MQPGKVSIRLIWKEMVEILIATKANAIFQNYNENKEGNHERKKLTTQN
jgi:hypothetical protein